MATTAIEWATDVWNPTTGCDRVSPGCDHCYASPLAKRVQAMERQRMAVGKLSPDRAKYQRDGDPRTSGPGFGIAEHPTALDAPLHWRKPRRIFVNSMSDLFHKGVSDRFIAQVWAVMAATPHHTYQVLTKRHGRMRSLLSDPGWPMYVGEVFGQDHDGEDVSLLVQPALPNVWLGVSVEDQKRADLRIPALLGTPAAVRWLSCEPLLGPVELNLSTGDAFPSCGYDHYDEESRRSECWQCIRPTWVVVGGESGPGARPMHPAWARTLRDQCERTGVPFFFKQWGAWGPLPGLTADGRYRDDPCVALANDGTAYGPGDLSWPDGPRAGEAIRAGHDRTGDLTHMYRAGKHDTGRELDGRTHDAYPAVSR